MEYNVTNDTFDNIFVGNREAFMPYKTFHRKNFYSTSPPRSRGYHVLKKARQAYQKSEPEIYMMNFQADVVAQNHEYFQQGQVIERAAMAHSEDDSQKGSSKKLFPLPKLNDWNEWRRQVKAFKLRKSQKAHNILIQADVGTYLNEEELEICAFLGVGNAAQPNLDQTLIQFTNVAFKKYAIEVKALKIKDYHEERQKLFGEIQW